MNTIYVDTIYLVVNMWFNNWSNRYLWLGPTGIGPRNTPHLVQNYGQLGPKTSRPRTTRPIKKSAQDNSAQVDPNSEDNSAQIAPAIEELSAHENQTKHRLMY